MQKVKSKKKVLKRRLQEHEASKKKRKFIFLGDTQTHKTCAFFRWTFKVGSNILYGVQTSDTQRADVGEKKMLQVRSPGALWTRPK